MQNIRRNITRFFCILLLLALFPSPHPSAAPVSANDTPDRFSILSPNGRFLFRQTMESEDGDAAFDVIDTRARRSVLIDPGASLPPMEDSIACIWSPDSMRFAVNARVAGRYETTEFFAWTGQQFQHLPSIEHTITAILATDRQARLKKTGVPANTALRHLWDTYKTLQWKSPDTLKVLGSSTRSYESKETPKAVTEIVSAFTFTLKFHKHAPPKIIAQSPAPPQQRGH
jgi:hypothetical protein